MFAGQTERSLLFDLRVIIHETDCGERYRDKQKNPDEPIGKIAPKNCGEQNAREDDQSSHRWRSGLSLMGGRAFFPDVLADLKLLQLADSPTPEE